MGPTYMFARVPRAFLGQDLQQVDSRAGAAIKTVISVLIGMSLCVHCVPLIVSADSEPFCEDFLPKVPIQLPYLTVLRGSVSALVFNVDGVTSNHCHLEHAYLIRQG